MHESAKNADTEIIGYRHLYSDKYERVPSERTKVTGGCKPSELIDGLDGCGQHQKGVKNEM